MTEIDQDPVSRTLSDRTLHFRIDPGSCGSMWQGGHFVHVKLEQLLIRKR